MMSIPFGFVAGILSILSPCVLPLVPIVVGTAASAHRFGAIALASGLSLSFTGIGLFVAIIGFGIGLDEGFFRMVGGVMLAAVGTVLLMPVLQERLAVVAAPVGDWAGARLGSGQTGLGAQFGVGVLLGAVWAPCVGPTLGAASLMAARGENLIEVGATMVAFGLGAGLPLVALGLASRELLVRWRGRLAGIGGIGKQGLGLVLVTIGLAIVSGADKKIEAFLTGVSPAWLTELTTRF